MSKVKKIVLWLVGPYVLILTAMILNTVGQAIFGGIELVAALIATISTLMGVVAVVLIPVSIIMAIVIAARPDSPKR